VCWIDDAPTKSLQHHSPPQPLLLRQQKSSCVAPCTLIMCVEVLCGSLCLCNSTSGTMTLGGNACRLLQDRGKRWCDESDDAPSKSLQHHSPHQPLPLCQQTLLCCSMRPHHECGCIGCLFLHSSSTMLQHYDTRSPCMPAPAR
jgi:hypothetical protein